MVEQKGEIQNLVEQVNNLLVGKKHEVQKAMDVLVNQYDTYTVTVDELTRKNEIINRFVDDIVTMFSALTDVAVTTKAKLLEHKETLNDLENRNLLVGFVALLDMYDEIDFNKMKELLNEFNTNR